jgi:hypothetical protein
MESQIVWEDEEKSEEGRVKMEEREKWNRKIIRLFFSFPIVISCFCGALPSYAQTLPIQAKESAIAPDLDPPDEVLRVEIYTEARSPIDGKLLTAAEYIELADELSSLDRVPPDAFVSPSVRRIIELLRLRKLFRQIIPFIP